MYSVLNGFLKKRANIIHSFSFIFCKDIPLFEKLGNVYVTINFLFIEYNNLKKNCQSTIGHLSSTPRVRLFFSVNKIGKKIPTFLSKLRSSAIL